ncbi:MAG TPA: hypothetical protein ENI07_09930 [Desulfobacterales bacterium]|nr:hypothetical protein [Desulfobacterales bacterium]
MLDWIDGDIIGMKAEVAGVHLFARRDFVKGDGWKFQIVVDVGEEQRFPSEREAQKAAEITLKQLCKKVLLQMEAL